MWDTIEDERMTRLIGVGIQIFLGVVGAFTLLVAGVGVANIMYVVVRERTREIGVKLAMGARRRHIVAQFVFEALLLAFLGGLGGLALSAGSWRRWRRFRRPTWPWSSLPIRSCLGRSR